jgi:hypothetical protein
MLNCVEAASMAFIDSQATLIAYKVMLMRPDVRRG